MVLGNTIFYIIQVQISNVLPDLCPSQKYIPFLMASIMLPTLKWIWESIGCGISMEMVADSKILFYAITKLSSCCEERHLIEVSVVVERYYDRKIFQEGYVFPNENQEQS